MAGRLDEGNERDVFELPEVHLGLLGVNTHMLEEERGVRELVLQFSQSFPSPGVRATEGPQTRV
jgi:hypothetical protein